MFSQNTQQFYTLQSLGHSLEDSVCQRLNVGIVYITGTTPAKSTADTAGALRDLAGVAPVICTTEVIALQYANWLHDMLWKNIDTQIAAILQATFSNAF